MNKCLACGKDITNKEFCDGTCRKAFNTWYKECSGVKRSQRGLRA